MVEHLLEFVVRNFFLRMKTQEAGEQISSTKRNQRVESEEISETH